MAAHTIAELCALIDPEEPDYVQIARLLSPDDVPELLAIATGNNPMRASKAAYALTLIHTNEAVAALKTAAASQDICVRIASAAGLSNLSGLGVTPVVETLIADADVGVRKLAINAVGTMRIAALTARLETLALNDPEPGIRSLARDTLDRMG